MRRYLKGIGLIVFSYLPSGVKIIFYQALGANIESDVYLGIGSYILPYYSSFKEITIDKKVSIGNNVVITAKRVRLGQGVEIKENTKISGESTFKMGDYSYIGENSLINLRRDVEIGVEAGVGANCSLYTHGVWLPAIDGYPAKFGKIIIKDKAWVSASIFIMPGITIGENAVVGSGSIVTKDVPDNTFVAGNPAKEIRKIDTLKPDLDQKNAMAKGMVDEFVERFNEKIKILNKTEFQIRFQMFIKKKKLMVFHKNEEYLIAYEKEIDENRLKEYIAIKESQSKNIILVSLKFQKNAKEKCVEKKINWIDLEERDTYLNSEIIPSLINKSFRNNGLKFSPIDEKNYKEESIA